MLFNGYSCSIVSSFISSPIMLSGFATKSVVVAYMVLSTNNISSVIPANAEIHLAEYTNIGDQTIKWFCHQVRRGSVGAQCRTCRRLVYQRAGSLVLRLLVVRLSPYLRPLHTFVRQCHARLLVLFSRTARAN